MSDKQRLIEALEADAAWIEKDGGIDYLTALNNIRCAIRVLKRVSADRFAPETPAKPARPRIEAPPSPTVADLIAFYADEHFETKGVTVSIPYRATRLALEDAARYRWLRDQPHADIAACWLLPNDVDANSPEELDAAIDKALGRVKCTCGRYTEDEKFFQLRDSRGGLHYTDRPCITPTTGEKS